MSSQNSGRSQSLEEQGLIQAFEYTHKLAWNVIKNFLENRHGIQNLYGSKDATREGFRKGLIENGQVWMEMINSRNPSSHTYNQHLNRTIAKTIREKYCVEFKRLLEKLEPFTK